MCAIISFRPIQGIFWIILFPAGVPILFLFLLIKFKVPVLAKRQLTDAWLNQVVNLAAMDGLALACTTHAERITAESIPMEDLLLLHNTYVGELEGGEAELRWCEKKKTQSIC